MLYETCFQTTLSFITYFTINEKPFVKNSYFFHVLKQQFNHKEIRVKEKKKKGKYADTYLSPFVFAPAKYKRVCV